MKIQRALISVSDKQGVVEFTRHLKNMGVEVLATGGTAKLLQDNNIVVRSISDFTGHPEILDGRVKTLHPKIHGSILFCRDNEQHILQAKEYGLTPIDLVIVNLYPFQETVAAANITYQEALEQIDIGGPSMIRAAAKNHAHVAVIVDPADYNGVIRELTSNQFELSDSTAQRLALKAFRHTAAYDIAISDHLSRVIEDDPFPGHVFMDFRRIQTLRYGENPHQKAAVYRSPNAKNNDLAMFKQDGGKELSFNNFLDMEAAFNLIREFEMPACVIIKHNNPCGVGLADTLEEAYTKALATDPISAFGGVIGLNRIVDGQLSRLLMERFIEVVIAPAYTDEAFTMFKGSRNLRLVRMNDWHQAIPHSFDWDIRQIGGGLLLQDKDLLWTPISEAKVVTKRAPTADQLLALDFAQRVAKHVKSNAIVIAGTNRTIGIGAGQMSRVDSVRLAIQKANDANLALQDTILASDAFFPFRDGIDVAAEVGIKAIVQPGGSIHDKEIIQAADELDLAMIFTMTRHFRH